jgi:hypothetical protein
VDDLWIKTETIPDTFDMLLPVYSRHQAPASVEGHFQAQDACHLSYKKTRAADTI